MNYIKLLSKRNCRWISQYLILPSLGTDYGAYGAGSWKQSYFPLWAADIVWKWQNESRKRLCLIKGHAGRAGFEDRGCPTMLACGSLGSGKTGSAVPPGASGREGCPADALISAPWGPLQTPDLQNHNIIDPVCCEKSKEAKLIVVKSWRMTTYNCRNSEEQMTTNNGGMSRWNG